MKEKYGNTFNSGREELGNAGRVSLWPMVDEYYPVGVFVPVDETNTVGKKIPAGTPISVDVVGGAPTLGGTAPIGLTYEDAYVGTDGCTFTIVTSSFTRLLIPIQKRLRSKAESCLLRRLNYG